MNWGVKLAVAMLTFMVFVVAMGIFMMRSSSQLVEENYYEKDLNYQQNIEAQKNALIEDTLVVFNTDSLPEKIVVQFNTRQNITGNILFLKPEDKAKDVSFPISVDAQGRQVIDTHRLSRGRWRVVVQWEIAQKNYEKVWYLYL